MPTRDEIAHIIDPDAFAESRPNLMNRESRRLSARRTAAVILFGLDWTESGLRRAVEIISKERVQGLTGKGAAALMIAALEAEINGDDYG